MVTKSEKHTEDWAALARWAASARLFMTELYSGKYGARVSCKEPIPEGYKLIAAMQVCRELKLSRSFPEALLAAELLYPVRSKSPRRYAWDPNTVLSGSDFEKQCKAAAKAVTRIHRRNAQKSKDAKLQQQEETSSVEEVVPESCEEAKVVSVPVSQKSFIQVIGKRLENGDMAYTLVVEVPHKAENINVTFRI